jgi:signal transduction histidine kinase
MSPDDDPAELSVSTRRTLRRLRVRFALLIAGLAAAAVVVLAIFAIHSDRELRNEQIGTELLRKAELISRSVTIVDGRIVADPPGDEIGADPIAVGMRPEFNGRALGILDRYRDDFADLSREDLRRRISAVWAGLTARQRQEILAPQIDGPDVDEAEAIDDLIADPPPTLLGEAFRRYALLRAERDGIELRAPVRLVVEAEPFDNGRVIDLLTAVIDGDLDSAVQPGWADGMWARGVPVREGAEVRGAALAFVDPAPFDDAHSELRSRVLIAAGVTLMVAAVAAWYVAGRTVRPAEGALGQQERFIADAAHELRTPVAAIRATAERGLGSEGDPATALARVAELAEAASELTDDLLTLARIDAGKVSLEQRAVRLDALVETIADDYEGLNVDVEQAVVMADHRLLARAIDNLIRNAVAHGAFGDPSRVVVIVREGEVRVVDAGPGIPEHLLDSIFDRFRTGAGSTGHGLGLALARWIVRSHDGDITARNRPNGGAEFLVTLPPARSATSPRD